MMEIEDIHVPFLAWLHELRIPFVYHRPDRKSGIQTGWPDFTVLYEGRVALIEAKTAAGRLSEVQESVHAFLRGSGNPVEVCRSVEECKEAVRKWILHPGLTETFSGVGSTRSSEAVEAERRQDQAEPCNTALPSNFFIGDWQGKPFVFSPDQSGAFRMIREASVIDRLRLPKLP
jgi:hypothetical protein